MRKLFGPARRRTLALGFLAVLVPLITLLAVQYVWLNRLADVSAYAYQASLHHYVQSVGREVEYFYRTQGERCLHLPASMFDGDARQNVAEHWAATPAEGAGRLFLVDYTEDAFGKIYQYNADFGRLDTAIASEESFALIMVCSSWQILAYRGNRAEPVGLISDERNRDYRFVYNPIIDDESRVIAVAAMILDEEHFRARILPGTVRETLRSFFPEGVKDLFALTVRDGTGSTVFQAGDGSSEWRPGDEESPVRADFPFVFADWSITLEPRAKDPESLARASFVSNMTVAALLALVLLGGVAFALRAANRAVTLSEMKADFVSNVSHELRTPLASIRAFAEFLKLGRATTPDKVQSYGRHIESESRRLSRLIDNILDFSRIESGRKEYDFQEESFDELVAAAVETFRMRTDENGFDIEYEPPEPLPPVSLDTDAVGLALHNLIDNAVKYSGDSRRLVVRLARQGDEAVCTVEDFGVGIPHGEQKKIFDRFHRVGTGLVHDVKGSGLGLSIVQHVVRAHGGEVTLESEPGRGTKIGFRLPLVASPRKTVVQS